MTRAGLFATALALGWVFVRAEFGYTAGFRHLLRTGNGSPLAIGVIVAAVAALVVLPLSGLRPGYFGANVAVSLPLILGAALFGLGMQLANGCGSGTLYAAGSLSRRLLIALPCFCIGGSGLSRRFARQRVGKIRAEGSGPGVPQDPLRVLGLGVDFIPLSRSWKASLTRSGSILRPLPSLPGAVQLEGRPGLG